MTQTPAEREQMIADLRMVFKDRAEVAAAYLYGSVARGEAGVHADVDVAVLPVVGLDEARRARLQRDLLRVIGDLSGDRAVDVRFFDELPLPVRGRLLHEGVRVADRDPALRVRTEVQTRMEYHDFQHFEQEGARQWAKAARERLGNG